MNLLPETSEKAALALEWFPTRWQAVLWRNWGVVPIDRLCAVLGADESTLRAAAGDMGLDPKLDAEPMWLTRGYLTIIRDNWHLCSFEQIQMLLGISAEKLAFLLKEDDFLWHKLGKIKPTVPDNRFSPLTDGQRTRTAHLRALVEDISPELRRENAFGFVRHFSGAPVDSNAHASEGGLATVYSYFALYGDPLMNPEFDPFPDTLLCEYAKMGVRGVWLQGILYQLIEFPFAPEMSRGHETRMRNLNSLIERAGRYGISVYLYLNEPRSMNDAFFKKRPELRGEREDDFYAMCTSRPEVKRYLEDGMKQLFAEAPGLGGFFTITMSENLTNCYSRAKGPLTCPRCAARKPWEVVAEVNNLMARGAHASAPNARAIAWSWAWGDEWAAKVPALLTEGQIVQCVSEERLATNVGGVAGVVRDYSISQPGPGQKALTVWSAARESGHETCAKVQINNSWEMSAVPYLPVFDKVAEHILSLKAAGVKHLQMSWTLGGYPTPMLRMASRMMSEDISVHDYLIEWLGAEHGDTIDRAQRLMSRAFGEFPFNIEVLYTAPQNYGPMAPFYLTPTGYTACMIGFPYDDITTWRAIYDEDTFERQFDKLVTGWHAGVEMLRPFADLDGELGEVYRMAAGALSHFEATLNQIRFVRARRRFADGDEKARSEMLAIIESERTNVMNMLALRHKDDRIGYEASNHYYYTVNDLIEKLINIDYCKAELNR